MLADFLENFSMANICCTKQPYRERMVKREKILTITNLHRDGELGDFIEMTYWIYLFPWGWWWWFAGKTESRHKTILGGGSSSSASISLHRCVLRDCCDNRVHCPFCDIRQYKPAQPARVRDHLHLTHFQHAVYYDGRYLKDSELSSFNTLSTCCVLQW